MRIRNSLRRGVSLFEAIVAVSIVGMTSVGALEAVGGDMRTAERSRRALEAEALATSRLQFMDLLTDQELQSLADSVQKGTFPAPLDEYSWLAASAPLNSQAGIYDVHITVNWPGGSYVVRTYEYRRPPLATQQ